MEWLFSLFLHTAVKNSSPWTYLSTGHLRRTVRKPCMWCLVTNHPCHTITMYDISGIVNSSLHLAASPGNIKAGFQVSGNYPATRIFFMTNLWGLMLQIDLPLLWLQQLPTVTVNPHRRRLILQDHQHLHPSSPEDIRPPKAGPRKSQNVKKKKKKKLLPFWLILRQKCFKKTTTHILEQNRKTGPNKRGKRSVCNASSKRFTRETPKNVKKSKNASDTKEEVSKGTLCLYFLNAYSRSASREMWIQCVECKLWWQEKCTDGNPTFICSDFRSDGSEYFV